MGKLILIIFTFCSLIGAYSQEAAFDWARSIGSSNNDFVTDIAIDNAGEVYIVGGFEYTMDFDPTDGVEEHIPVGSFDIYITKLSEEGSYEWSLTLGSSFWDVATAVHCDEFGFIYITGRFSGTLDFDPGPDIFELTAESDGDCFILKLDSDGDFVWAKGFGDALFDIGDAIDTDESGNVYTTGRYQGTVDFDPGPDAFDITSEGEEDVFILKLNSDGDFVWAKSVGGGSKEEADCIIIDDLGNVILSGYFTGESDFDPGLGLVLFTPTGASDAFILKLDDNGDFIWVKQLSGDFGERVLKMDSDADGNIYSVGFYNENIDLDPSPDILEFESNGNNDAFIQKLDSEGDLVWGKSYGGVGQDRAQGVALDEFGEIYTIGYFAETVDFNPNAGISNFTSEGGGDIFLQKLDQDGDFIWTKSIGSALSDHGEAVQINSENDIYLTGDFELTADFNPGIGEYELESNGGDDIFILNLNACSPSATTDEITACISHTWIDGETYYESNNTATHTLTNVDGCDSVITLDLTINEVDITTSAVGGTITSNATGATYQWLDCNDGYSEIDGETSMSYTPSGDGDYAVEVTTEECVDTSDCVSIDGVGISKNNLDMISVYPNPSQGTIFIKGLEMGSYDISIFSVTGGTILQQSISGQELAELELPQGQYILMLVGDDQIRHIKVVITG